LTDQEILERRLELFTSEAWSIWISELEDFVTTLEELSSINDEKTLFYRKGQVDILNMMINLEDTTKLALDQLEQESQL
jgi:hypothetical protein